MVHKLISLCFFAILSIGLTACDFGSSQIVTLDAADLSNDAADEDEEVSYRTIIDGDVDVANLFPQVVWVNNTCTGTLVGKRFVLTAGHCVTNKLPVENGNPQCNSTHIRSAASAKANAMVYFLTGDGMQPAIEAEVIVHPEYLSCLNLTESGFKIASQKTDIAILKLAANPPLGIDPIALTGEMATKGEVCTLAGFGRSSCNGQLDGNRRFGTNVISSTNGEWLTVHTYAADTITWKGDSGGPLLVANAGGDLVVAGVTSSGGNLDDEGCPHKATYCSVWHNRDWIIEQLSAPEVSPPLATTPQNGATVAPGSVTFKWSMVQPAYRGCVQICAPNESTCLDDPNFGGSLIQAEPGIEEYAVEVPTGAWKWRAGAIADDGIYDDASWVYSPWQGLKAEQTDGPEIVPTVWVSPTSGPQGTVFEEGGHGFTPGGTALLFFQKPDGLWYEEPVLKVIGPDGSYLHSYDSITASLFGTYHYQAVDETTSKQSNTVSFLLAEVETGPSCGDSACNGSENCGTCLVDCPCGSGTLCQGGQCLDPCAGMNCSDGNVCTADSCANGKCVHSFVAGSCSDGDSCTTADHCSEGNCVGSPVDCNDSNPCTADLCANGCQHSNVANGTGCGLGKTCQSGQCLAPLPSCGDGSCNGSENCYSCPGDCACSGKLVCQAGQCVDPCAGKNCSDGNACTTDSCANGICVHSNVAGNCNDGDACTDSDHCSGGVCIGSPVSCNDGNICTTDYCAGGCKHTTKSDGTACGGANVCQDGICGTPPANCGDGMCNGTENCSTCPGDCGCDGKLVCQAGQCVDTCAGKNCNDGNVCTADSCANGICIHSNISGNCNDGNSCTVSDHCVAGKCVGSTANCNDYNACTKDSCSGGCKHTVVVDGSDCGSGKICLDGVCTTPPPFCGDGECNGMEDCDECTMDCGICGPDVCDDMQPGECTPFTMTLPPGTNAITIEWWPAVGAAIKSTKVTFSGGTWQSPKGACAATILYAGRWESWLDGTFPEGAPVGSCTISCGGLGTVDFCELPGGQAGWGCAHDTACKINVGENLVTNSDFANLGDSLSSWPAWQAWSDPSVPASKKLQCEYDLSTGTPAAPSAKCVFNGPAITDWYVQFSHSQVPIKAGKQYMAKYCLKGSTAGQLAHVIVQHTYSGQNVGLWETIPLQPGQWVCETKTFFATHTFADAKMTIWLGEANGGPVWMDQLELREL